jgi:hypothetical protein
MTNLVTVGLWEYVYEVSGKQYVYISQFEVKNREGIRKRSCGEYPDESGAIPRRLVDGNRQEPIEDSLKRSEVVRKSYYPQVANIGNNCRFSENMTVSRETSGFPENSGIFRKIPGELSRGELSRGELNTIPESPAGGSLKKNESNQSASSTERKSPEVFGGNLSKNTDNSTQNISCSGQGMPQTLSRSLSTV